MRERVALKGQGVTEGATYENKFGQRNTYSSMTHIKLHYPLEKSVA
jgi:hypothetical protein